MTYGARLVGDRRRGVLLISHLRISELLHRLIGLVVANHGEEYLI